MSFGGDSHGQSPEITQEKIPKVEESTTFVIALTFRLGASAHTLLQRHFLPHRQCASVHSPAGPDWETFSGQESVM